jgi:hypothetical protein
MDTLSGARHPCRRAKETKSASGHKVAAEDHAYQKQAAERKLFARQIWLSFRGQHRFGLRLEKRPDSPISTRD